MPLLTRPTFLSFNDWASQVVLDDLTGSAIPLPPQNEDEWQNWAYWVVQAPQIARYCPPDPREYEDWRAWAEQLIIGVD